MIAVTAVTLASTIRGNQILVCQRAEILVNRLFVLLCGTACADVPVANDSCLGAFSPSVDVSVASSCPVVGGRSAGIARKPKTE